MRQPLAKPITWWRVAIRDRPRDVPTWSAYLVPGLVALGLLFITVDLSIRPLFLGDDSVHNYAHVWYISQQLFQHGRIPLHIALLDGGRAVTFPYGFVPYLASAILFRAFGNWAVTFMMVVAVLGTVWAAGLVRPVMRDSWFIILLLLNPFFIDAIYAFQFATLWSILFFLLFVWAVERRRHVLSALLLWLAIASHPIMGGLAAGCYGACLLAFDREKVRPLVVHSVPVAIALVPIYWMTLLTPSVRENSIVTVVKSVLDVLPRRGSILLTPFALTLLAPYVRRFYLSSLAMFMVAAALGIVFSAGFFALHSGSYYGAIHGSTDNYVDFFRSSAFKAGASYRVMEPNEREDGMYYFMQHGAVLSNEFFSESMFRRNWTEPQYACYAAFKRIDYVVIERAYQRQFQRNEQTLLQSLVQGGRAKVVYGDALGRFTVYDVRRFARERPRPGSLDDCGLY